MSTILTGTLGPFVQVKDEATYHAALKLARGCYQQNIIHGLEAVSGSTLRGYAKTWGAKYWRSRCTLFARMQKAGLRFTTEYQAGRVVLVIG